MSFIDDMQVTHNDDATVTITGEIPFTELAAQRDAAISHLGKNITVDGFRPGHVPTTILAEKIGEMNILAEMAERTLEKTYPKIITTHKIDAIGYPSVSLTKLAPDNPLGFTITVAIVPSFSLPDYRTIATTHHPDHTEVVVSDEEVEAATKDVLRRKVAYDRIQRKAAAQAKATDPTDLPTPDSVGHPTEDEDGEIRDDQLPALTDEVAKELGDFSTAAAFAAKVREELTERAQQERQTKHRAAVSDALVAATDITVPAVMIDAEIEQFMAQMKDDLQRAHITLEDYLGHLKKTEAELKADWRPSAEKRAKVQLILNAIADAENIAPDEKIVSDQVAALKQRYSDANESQIRTYVISVLRNEAVMKLLEGTDVNDADKESTPTDSESPDVPTEPKTT